MDFVGRTIDVFRSLPDIVVDPRNLGLAHPVGPHDPGAKPLRMVDHDMKRRPLDGNARSLKPDTQLCENFVNEALIARAACKPVHDVAVRMRRGGLDVWRRVHFVAPQSDLDRRYRICRVPARRRQWSPPQSACAASDRPRVAARPAREDGSNSSAFSRSIQNHMRPFGIVIAPNQGKRPAARRCSNALMWVWASNNVRCAILASLALLSMKPRTCSTSVWPPRSMSRSIDVEYCESGWENVSSHNLIKASLGG